MADIKAKVKQALNSSAKFVSKTASAAAQATKFKMNEMSQLSKRRELIGELGAKVFELSSNGVEMPCELTAMIQQITQLDADLEALRADYAARKAAQKDMKNVPEAEAAEDTAAPEQETSEAAENASADEVPTLDV